MEVFAIILVCLIGVVVACLVMNTTDYDRRIDDLEQVKFLKMKQRKSKKK